MGGETAHHKKLINMAMQLPNGTLDSNSSEKMAVFGPHFERVFSNHQPVDLSILDLIPQQEQLMEIDHPITFSEVDNAINKLRLLGSMAFRQKHTRPSKRKCECRFTVMLANSLMAPETTMDGTRASAFLSLKRAILQTPTNGEASCSWMSAVRSLVLL